MKFTTRVPLGGQVGSDRCTHLVVQGLQTFFFFPNWDWTLWSSPLRRPQTSTSAFCLHELDHVPQISGVLQYLSFSEQFISLNIVPPGSRMLQRKLGLPSVWRLNEFGVLGTGVHSGHSGLGTNLSACCHCSPLTLTLAVGFYMRLLLCGGNFLLFLVCWVFLSCKSVVFCEMRTEADPNATTCSGKPWVKPLWRALRTPGLISLLCLSGSAPPGSTHTAAIRHALPCIAQLLSYPLGQPVQKGRWARGRRVRWASSVQEHFFQSIWVLWSFVSDCILKP